MQSGVGCFIIGSNPIKTHPYCSIRESKMKITTAKLIRWAGLSAMVAGILYMLVGMFHPLNILSSVTTTRWLFVHILATTMCFFVLLGLAGLYARQAEKSGWLGLVGFFLYSLSWVLTLGYTFAEVFILPLLATQSPTFVQGFLGAYSSAGDPNFAVLANLWSVTGILYIGGGLLFGIATFRAGILSRGAAGLLAVGSVLSPLAALLPHQYEPLVAVPVGLALAWLGYALFSERREPASEPAPCREAPSAGLAEPG
jgi:hypothetical protein